MEQVHKKEGDIITEQEIIMKLWSARSIGFELEALKEQEKQLLSAATSITSQLKDVVISGSAKDEHAKMDNFAINMEYVHAQMENCLKVQREVMQLISQLKDARYRAVLLQYYINRRTWVEVADSMRYDIRHVYRLRDRAISALEKSLNVTV